MLARVEWSQEHDRKLLALKEYGPTGAPLPGGTYQGLKTKGRSFADVARLMNAWFGTDIFTKDACQKRFNSLTPPLSLRDFPPANPTPYFSAHFDADGKPRQVAKKWNPWQRVERLFGDEGRWVKTLVLSDQQGVFCDESRLQRALDLHPDADIVVCPGDIADWEGASKYTHERDYPLLYESDWLVRLYTTLSERYPEAPIFVTDSNHRRRVAKAVRSLPQGLLFLAEHNPERYLAQPFPNVFALDEWWFQLGDTVYCHNEGPTATPGANVRNAIEKFELWRRSAQFPVQPFRAVVSGHSHKLATVFDQAVLGIEPGCLAKLPMNYMKTAEISQIQENGYAIVVQRAGRADLNETRAYSLRDA